MFPDGLKHDEMQYPYIRDMMQRKIVHMQYLPTHVLHIIFVTLMIVNDVNLYVAFREVNGLNS
jgi:hypothetical protein